MTTRITLDLKNPQLFKQLKWVATERGQSLRDTVVAALESYFSAYLENKALLKLSGKVFEEWDNPKDSDYDRIQDA